MKISSSAYFDFEALVQLAACDAGRPRMAQSLAQSIDRSMSYTEKLMAELREAGLIKAKQGPTSCRRLTAPASAEVLEIRV